MDRIRWQELLRHTRWNKEIVGKLRPQIFLSIIVLGVLSAIGAMQGYNEIATGCVGGIIALGMKVLENE